MLPRRTTCWLIFQSLGLVSSVVLIHPRHDQHHFIEHKHRNVISKATTQRCPEHRRGGFWTAHSLILVERALPHTLKHLLAKMGIRRAHYQMLNHSLCCADWNVSDDEILAVFQNGLLCLSIFQNPMKSSTFSRCQNPPCHPELGTRSQSEWT